MRQHTYVCKSIAAAEDNDQEEEEYKNDDSGDKDNAVPTRWSLNSLLKSAISHIHL